MIKAKEIKSKLNSLSREETLICKINRILTNQRDIEADLEIKFTITKDIIM